MIQNKDKKYVIAAFDFDGTITTKDTLFDFISFYHGKIKLLIGLFILSPILILYVLGFMKNSKAKQRMFSYFFKGESIDKFTQKCNNYISRIDKICNADTLSKLRWHQQQGHVVVIVSASIDKWIKPWAQKMGINQVLGTTIVEQDGRVEGHFLSKNCYGSEKVNRLLDCFPNREDYILYAYGDSSGDKELLELSDHPLLIN